MDDAQLRLIDHSQMKLCVTCFKVYGFWWQNLGREFDPSWSWPRYQCCACLYKEGQPLNAIEPWSGFDFNEVVTLCHCCQGELLRSGSRWSVWFCQDCKEMVLQFNREAGSYIIPIGRHSAMGRSPELVLEGNARLDLESQRGFIVATVSLSDRMDILEAWRRESLAAIWASAKRAGADSVKLAVHLKLAADDRPAAKTLAFERMRRAFETAR